MDPEQFSELAAMFNSNAGDDDNSALLNMVGIHVDGGHKPTLKRPAAALVDACDETASTVEKDPNNVAKVMAKKYQTQLNACITKLLGDIEKLKKTKNTASMTAQSKELLAQTQAMSKILQTAAASSTPNVADIKKKVFEAEKLIRKFKDLTKKNKPWF